MASFDIAFGITCKFEGGYTNNPTDKGGETYQGISRRFFPSWSGWPIVDKIKDQAKPNWSQLDLLVKEFYRQEFWKKVSGDSITSQAIANELFDTAVNMSQKTAVLFLQQSLNVLNKRGSLYPDLTEDGVVGVGTLKAVSVIVDRKEEDELLLWMNNRQGNHYYESMRKDPSQETFARGWGKRFRVTKVA